MTVLLTCRPIPSHQVIMRNISIAHQFTVFIVLDLIRRKSIILFCSTNTIKPSKWDIVSSISLRYTNHCFGNMRTYTVFFLISFDDLSLGLAHIIYLVALVILLPFIQLTSYFVIQV